MRIKPKIYGLVTSDQAQNIVKVIKIIPQIEFSDLVITVKKDKQKPQSLKGSRPKRAALPLLFTNKS